MEKVNNDQIIGLMSLSEEINSLNQKMRQMVEQLHSTSEGLASLQDLANTMNSKIGQFKTQAGKYTPQTLTQGKGATPSYGSTPVAGVERERIVPTPENYRDYLPENMVPVTKAPKAPELPTAAELTNVQSTPVVDRETGKVPGKKQTKQKTQRSKRTTKKPTAPKKRGFFGGKK